MEIIVKHFDELTTRELYEILKTRFEIFVTEQECLYQDLDDKDQDAIHVFCWNDEGRVAGCLRVFMKDAENGIVQIGRVVTLEHGKGLGGKLLREGVKVATKSFNAIKIYLEAQVYAIGYYAKEGFEVVSDEFMEDGIPHVKMEKRVRTDDGLPLIELNVLSEEEIQEARDKKDKEIAEKSRKVRLSDLQVSELYNDHMTKKPEVLKLHLELKMKRASREDVEVLRKYAKVENDRITRDILVPADITLHALSYAIQRCFGWQNSHLHCFKYPAAVFQEMTGGKEEPRDDVYCKYDGLVTEWIKLCGLYFRFPTTEYEDLYWDDDYEDGQNFKVWQRKKYTGPYDYHGKWELYHFAHPTAQSLIEQNPMIRVTPSFDEWMEKGKKSEDRMVPIEKASIRDIQFGFEGGMDELLEKTPLIELLIPERVKRDENALSQLDFLCKRQEKESQELPVIPMAHYLNYLYDYGDGWEVKITLTDLYYTKTRWDVVKECDVRSRTFVAKVDDKAFLEDTTAYDMNNQPLEYEYAKKVATVHYKKKPTCVALDGMCVMDDVGGMGGYIDFLQNLKHGDPEERKELRDWATYMGWTGKLPKPESLL